jgi:RHS repeat-associated protein
MQTFVHSSTGRAIVLSLVVAMLSAGCGPGFLAAAPGCSDYHRWGFIEVPGGIYDAPGLNLMVERADVSLDTLVWTQTIGAVYSSANARWHWTHEMSYDGALFVDPSGAELDAGAVPDGSAIPGTHWVRVDATTVKTKGGQTYHFDAQARLDFASWANGDYPQIRYLWEPGALRLRLCTAPSLPVDECPLLFTIERDSAGRPARVVDERSALRGLSIEALYEYDASGRLARARTPFEVEQGLPGTRYEYDALGGRLSAIVSSEGERIEYTWNGAMLDTVTQVGEGSPTHTFRYRQSDTSPKTYTVAYTNPLGGRTEVTFDGRRRVLAVERLDAGESRLLSWPGDALHPTSVSDFDGTTQRFEAWEDGDPTRIALPSGNVVEIAYEPDGVDFEQPWQRPLRAVADSLGAVVRVEYDALGRPRTESNGEGEEVTTTYANSFLEQIALPSGVTTELTSYGLHGHWLEAQSPAQPEVPLRRKLDAVGNLLVPGAGLQEGGVLERRFDPDRRLREILVAATDEAGGVGATDSVLVTRRSDGQILEVHRPHGADHRMEYDALGRLARLRELAGGSWRDTTFEYDAAGDLLALQQPNGMREEFAYDAYRRVTRHTALRDGVAEMYALFEYADGRLARWYDSARDQWETLLYDAAGRPQEVTYSALGESLGYEYDPRSRVTRKTYRVGDLAREIGIEWDLADRRTRVFTWNEAGAEQDLVRLVYREGRLAAVEYGNGLVRENLFDPQTGRFEGYRTTDAQGALLEETTLTKEAKSSPARIEVTSVTQTPLATTREETWIHRGGSLQSAAGEVGARVFHWWGSTWVGGVLQDEDERVYAWDELSNPASDAAGDVFAYNAERSRLLSADSNGVSHSYTYDEAGYATSRDGLPIAWTATGRLARIGPALAPLAEIEWDMAGRPVSITVGGATRAFALFGGSVELDPVTQQLGWLHLTHVSLPFRGDERRYVHLDPSGNVGFVTDEQGGITSQRRYHPFGLDRVYGSEGLGGAISQGFVGGAELAGDGIATGLVLLGARVLDSDTGRFLSPDPELQLLNQYTYALGNPVQYWDPDGQAGSAKADVSAAAAEAKATALDSQAADLDARAANISVVAQSFLAIGGALLLSANPVAKGVGKILVAVGTKLQINSALLSADAARLRGEAAAIRAAQAAGAAKTRMPDPPRGPFHDATSIGDADPLNLSLSIGGVVAPSVCGPTWAVWKTRDQRAAWLLCCVLALLSLMAVELRRRSTA